MSWATSYSTKSLRRKLIRHTRRAWRYIDGTYRGFAIKEQEHAATIKTELTRRGEWTP